MTDQDAFIEKRGVTFAKVKEDGTIVDSLTEQELNEKQQNSIRKLMKVF